MIEFGVLTGEIDNNLLRVQYRTGEKFWAKMAMIGNNVSLPSETWIKTNCKNFLALVSFEKDLNETPIIIGFYPVNDPDSNSYNEFERLIKLVKVLLDTLKEATTMTQLGPQKFMFNTQEKLIKASDELTDISKNILNLKL